MVKDMYADEALLLLLATVVKKQIANRNDLEGESKFQLKGSLSQAPGSFALQVPTPIVFNFIFTNLSGLIHLDTNTFCPVQHKVVCQAELPKLLPPALTSDCKQEKTTGHHCTHLQCCITLRHQNNNKDHTTQKNRKLPSLQSSDVQRGYHLTRHYLLQTADNLKVFFLLNTTLRASSLLLLASRLIIQYSINQSLFAPKLSYSVSFFPSLQSQFQN